jgi:hypothetical protein
LHYIKTLIYSHLDVIGTEDEPATKEKAKVDGQSAQHEAQHVGEGILQGQNQNLKSTIKKK